MEEMIGIFKFTDFYNFVHDIVLLALIFKAGKNNGAAMPGLKGKAA